MLFREGRRVFFKAQRSREEKTKQKQNNRNPSAFPLTGAYRLRYTSKRAFLLTAPWSACTISVSSSCLFRGLGNPHAVQFSRLFSVLKQQSELGLGSKSIRKKKLHRKEAEMGLCSASVLQL